jgi:hypothetical protein
VPPELSLAICAPAVLGTFVLAAAFHRSSRRLKIIGILGAPITYFLIAFFFFAHVNAGIRDAGDRVCGALGAVEFVATVGGTLVQGLFMLVVWCIVALLRSARRASAHDHLRT